MLSKRFKLPIESFIVKRGKIVKNPFFLVKIYTPSLPYSRFGVTVSVKSAGKAVKRNRIRRLVYDFLAKNKENLPLADYWISVLPGAPSLLENQFMGELKKVLNLK